MTLEVLAVAGKERQLLVGVEYPNKYFDSDELGHLTTVGGLDAHQKRQRPQHVRTDELQRHRRTERSVNQSINDFNGIAADMLD